MLIAEQVTIRGAIDGSDDVVVRGRIEGAITVSGAVTVEAGATVEANVRAARVVVSGTLLGNVQATDSIEVARTARVVGDVTAPRVVIAAGAAFRGRVEVSEPPDADDVPAKGARVETRDGALNVQPATGAAPTTRKIPVLRSPPGGRAAGLRGKLRRLPTPKR